MQLCLVIEQRQTLRLAIAGGLTGEATVFPAVERWLQDDADHWHAFERIRGRKRAGRYRSSIDFLLCEVCTEERAGCFAFYRGDGPRLAELRSPAAIRVLESKLLLFLTIAHESFCQERALSWGRAVEMVRELCAA